MTKPYYQDSSVTIHHADCREIMSDLDTVDAVITDPPYGETSLKWDRFVSGWMDQLPANNLWCFGSLKFFFELCKAEVEDWTPAQDLIWEKHNGSGFHADRFKRVHELVLQFYRGAWGDIYKNPVYSMDSVKRTVRTKRRPTHMGNIDKSPYVSEDGGPRLMRSVIYVRSCHGEAVHPTQKPTGIIAPLIHYSIPPGGTVVDCFMGSGSTLVAAKELGRKSIGIDIDEKNCEIAARRIQQEVLAL